MTHLLRLLDSDEVKAFNSYLLPKKTASTAGEIHTSLLDPLALGVGDDLGRVDDGVADLLLTPSPIIPGNQWTPITLSLEGRGGSVAEAGVAAALSPPGPAFDRKEAAPSSSSASSSSHHCSSSVILPPPATSCTDDDVVLGTTRSSAAATPSLVFPRPAIHPTAMPTTTTTVVPHPPLHSFNLFHLCIARNSSAIMQGYLRSIGHQAEAVEESSKRAEATIVEQQQTQMDHIKEETSKKDLKKKKMADLHRLNPNALPFAPAKEGVDFDPCKHCSNPRATTTDELINPGSEEKTTHHQPPQLIHLPPHPLSTIAMVSEELIARPVWFFQRATRSMKLQLISHGMCPLGTAITTISTNHPQPSSPYSAEEKLKEQEEELIAYWSARLAQLELQCYDHAQLQAEDHRLSREEEYLQEQVNQMMEKLLLSTTTSTTLNSSTINSGAQLSHHHQSNLR